MIAPFIRTEKGVACAAVRNFSNYTKESFSCMRAPLIVSIHLLRAPGNQFWLNRSRCAKCIKIALFSDDLFINFREKCVVSPHTVEVQEGSK